MYNVLDVGTILSHRTAEGTSFPGPALGDQTDGTYGANMFYVIPEPGTIAFVLFGIGVLGVRRFAKARKA